MTTKNFNQAVLMVMERLNLRKADVAKLTGYSNAYVGDLLNGKRRWHDENIKRFCEALDIEITYELNASEVKLDELNN